MRQKDGTFAVLGAGDGEYQDLTLPLEKKLGWSGLLIEPHPDLFEMLKQKGRKATLSSNCVSPFAYPAIVSSTYVIDLNPIVFLHNKRFSFQVNLTTKV